jgi:hypothetical protein
VTLGLLAIGAIGRVKFERAGFWWATMAMVVGLSLGSYRRIDGHRVELPAGWLWHVFPPFRLIRDVSRFNMLAVIVGSVIAAGVLKQLMRGVESPWKRGAIVASLMGVVMWDLGVRIDPVAVPAVPAFYGKLLAETPGAAFLELEPPLPEDLPGPLAIGYWQAGHGGRSSISFSGLVNRRAKDRIGWSSPVAAGRVDVPGFLDDPGSGVYDFVSRQAFRDYAWLFMEANGYNYFVMHMPRRSETVEPEGRKRLREELAGAVVVDDLQATVFAHARMERPTKPTIVLTDGWRVGIREGACRVVGEEARIAYYNPDGARDLTVVMRARAFHRRREVRLMQGDRVLAHWAFGPGEATTGLASPFTLDEGVGELRLEVSGESEPRSVEERAAEWDERPYGLFVEELGLLEMPG